MGYEGWHRALDVQMETHKWCLSSAGRKINESVFWSLLTDMGRQWVDQDTDRESRNLSGHLIETLWRADTIYVTADMENLMVQAAEDLPDDVTFDVRVCMSKHGFVLLEQPIRGFDRKDREVRIIAFAWEITPIFAQGRNETKEAIMIYFFVNPLDVIDDEDRQLNDLMRESGISIPPVALLHMYPAEDGNTVPKLGEKGVEVVHQTLKLFLAMQMLSHQSIGEPMPMRPDRASRKRYAREYPGMPERLITLITLRRKKTIPEKPTGTVEWQRRWIVRGHWRRQYYPKSKTHGWKYIYEYIKGPDDKPLVTGRRVFNFRR
jgi:hypothetical protein